MAAEDCFYDRMQQPAAKAGFAVSVGAFIAVFMIVFQPFGVTNHDPDFELNLLFILLMGAFGLLVTGVLCVNEFVLRPLLPLRPGLASLTAWLAWTYLLTGSVVYGLYNLVGGGHDLSWTSWLGFIRDVGMIIAFPIAGYLFAQRHAALRSAYDRLQSSPPASSDRRVTFTSDNDKDPLVVALRDVLFCESEDNYVGITYLDGEAPATHLVRSTLKRLEAQLDDPALVRCHRSFIVNLARVRSCRGNRHGLHLKLDGMDGVVPVSRSYTDSVLAILQAG